MGTSQLKNLPSVSQVLLEVNQDNNYNSKYLKTIINQEIAFYRQRAKKGELKLSREEIHQRVVRKTRQLLQPSLKQVINGTGIVLHTGLGRAPVHPKISDQVAKQLSGYVNLEFDLAIGKRGERLKHLDGLLTALTGAESSLVVNNNAAAVLLGLNTLAEDREVVVSRGQQVEIGGSFRIPDVIQKGHCILREVGTTNRTHLEDYEKAISPQTALLLWVHSSNYVVKGFTSQVSLNELTILGKHKRIPVMADLGSGAFIVLSEKGLPDELVVQDIVKSGVDLVSFSGDKLLGGPQAGIIVGKRKWIKRLRKNPLYRAFRADKWTIALMEWALKTYGDQGPLPENLALDLLLTDRSVLRQRGEKVLSAVREDQRSRLGIKLVDTTVEAGSGSLPEGEIESVALQFNSTVYTAAQLAQLFRSASVPVIGYVYRNRYFIDLKAVLPRQLSSLARIINEV
jgi:L-seryl-tRNA(Ser) seleniumtransferase